ncbi:hypothetical protein EDB89DRAFT_1333257 [Lactarius sanguifluus]|nr:hypothetical protein EDB89DRAFT_1333257 [Lactarius sanguifluus]
MIRAEERQLGRPRRLGRPLIWLLGLRVAVSCEDDTVYVTRKEESKRRGSTIGVIVASSTDGMTGAWKEVFNVLTVEVSSIIALSFVTCPARMDVVQTHASPRILCIDQGIDSLFLSLGCPALCPGSPPGRTRPRNHYTVALRKQSIKLPTIQLYFPTDI